jgi:hypothetical protein
MGAERADLDAAATLFTEPLPMTTHTVEVQRRKVALALAAELRVAREVVAAARIRPNSTRKLRAALDAYDRHDPPAGGDQAEEGGS